MSCLGARTAAARKRVSLCDLCAVSRSVWRLRDIRTSLRVPALQESLLGVDSPESGVSHHYAAPRLGYIRPAAP